MRGREDRARRRLGLGAAQSWCVQLLGRLLSCPGAEPGPRFPRGASCPGVRGWGGVVALLKVGMPAPPWTSKEAFLAGPRGSLSQEPPGLG